MGSTRINSYTYPENTGAPVVATDMRTALDEVSRGGLMRFADATERTAAFAAAGISPSPGMLSNRANDGVMEMWNGTAWKLASPYRAKTQLTGTVASVTFTIPTTTPLHKLRIDWTARGDAATAQEHLRLRINADSTASYYTEDIQGNGAAAAAAFIASLATSAFAGHVAGNGSAAGIYSAGQLSIVGWDMPHSTYLGYTYQSASMTAGGLVNSGGGTYNATGPYLSVLLFPAAGNFVVGSTFSLEGWD